MTATAGADVLVGRDGELAALRAVFAAVAAGRPTIALLTGEAGIGKTRLADEAAVLARGAGMRVLRGQADAGARRPMQLWHGVYRALALVPGNDPDLPSDERRWEHLESLADALVAAGPVLVVLDDLHWADAVAVWVLEHLPRTLGDAPVALIATSRDHEPGAPRLDAVRRVSRPLPLPGLDVDAVRSLAAALATGPVDATELQARTGGNPLFVRELVVAPDGGEVIGDVLDHALGRFDDGTRELLATAAMAGPGTPLAVLARASGGGPSSGAEVADRLAVAVRGGVLDEVAGSGVRFRHALLAEAAARSGDAHALHTRLAAAWEAAGGLGGRASAAEHRLRAAAGRPEVAGAVAAACDLATELIAADQQGRAAGLLRDAHDAAEECVDSPELRARVALDLATVLRLSGDLDLALEHYEQAAALARDSSDPVLRARAAIGANLWTTAFVPDPARLRMLEETLATVPADELRLRSAVLRRLVVVGGADLDAVDRARAWAGEAVRIARQTGDPVLIAQALINDTMSPANRDELDARLAVADEVVRLADRARRPDLAVYGHQRRFCHHLNHGDVGAANHALERAELLAGLLPSPGWRQRTLVQRTTLLALTGGRTAATAAMDEAVRAGAGHIEPVVLLGCELMHRVMLVDLYGGTDPRAEEAFRTVVAMIGSVPSPLLQVQAAFAAQLLGDDARTLDLLHRYAGAPELLSRSMSGDQLLRVLGDTVARAGATAYAGPVYDALVPYSGLLNVGGGQSAGLPVDDVLGRLAALTGDVPGAVRHARRAVALARSLPSPPMLAHCLDHLADAVERAGDDGPDDADALRAESAELAGRGRPAVPAPRGRLPGARTATMRRDGALWVLTSPLGTAQLADSAGLGQLARLLQTPGVEVAAVELAGTASRPVAADLGPRLDAQAKRAYRQRLLDLQAEIDDAAACHDPVRGERAHVETEALLRELRGAVGIGGRDRPTGSDAERARVNVVRSLRRAIAAVTRQAPDLGAHLDVSVRTGRHCGYLPEPAAALSWTVEV